AGRITMAGNRKLKIYGTLICRSGKRITRAHRVFFISEQEAVAHAYRPCGRCMKVEYQTWKKSRHG
ncbi:MAG TPA: Ada metal-binding domain-containing protein, partial [Chryseolinea sp.]|nr:Ada metal-binding domain-containing protein [Chryseolinea sp.]